MAGVHFTDVVHLPRLEIMSNLQRLGQRHGAEALGFCVVMRDYKNVFLI